MLLHLFYLFFFSLLVISLFCIFLGCFSIFLHFLVYMPFLLYLFASFVFQEISDAQETQWRFLCVYKAQDASWTLPLNLKREGVQNPSFQGRALMQRGH